MWQRWVRGSLLGLTIVLTSFLLYLLATRTESVSPSPSANPSPRGRSDAGIDQFKFIQSHAGAVQWKVQAQRARVFEAEHRAALEQVQVTLYGPQGWELKLEGDEGTIDLARKDFVLVKHEGQIEVRLQSGYTIKTNHLAWGDQEREVTTADPVTIAGHGLIVQGRGLVGKLEMEEFRIAHDVHVVITQ
ncbi:MAG: LPS export ABC transporter periplasmic protein LptC [Nitrospira sp.]|nr:LPS export ABC transporter periplasmic protein LptC [Nitrospira sp.]